MEGIMLFSYRGLGIKEKYKKEKGFGETWKKSSK